MCEAVASVSGESGVGPASWRQLLTTLDSTFEAAKATILDRVDPVGVCAALGHLTRVLNYNVPHGKKTRAVALLYTWAVFSDSNAAPADVRPACPAAWAVELLQATFLVCDDIMDNSRMRRGRPCWFRVEGVGLLAINDALFLEQAAYALLSSEYGSHAQYSRLMDLFHSVTMTTCVGQTLDMTQGFDGLTWPAYREICCRKTSHYSFYLPVAAALLLRGREDLLEPVRPLLMRIGEFFQAQDDYLDFYGDPAVTGKIGTDIQEAKCSWLALTALDRLRAGDGDCDSKARLAQFLDNYGRAEPERVAAVAEIYRALGLDVDYVKFAEAEYASIRRAVDESLAAWPQLRTVCRDLLDGIHGRQK